MTMTSNQPFERLIRLEDEELGSNEEPNEEFVSDRDSCKVPMISNGHNTITNSPNDTFPVNKHRLSKNDLPGGGLHFTINGRRIQMNPEQLKYLSLITLTVQNAALNLVMRAATTQTEEFSKPVAVTVAEFLKFITCLVLVWYEEISINATYRKIKTSIFDNYMDTIKVAVPSFVYYVQNNLLYVGSAHLDAATVQVTYQLKILTTAVFSVLMLNKKLSKLQWVALVTLFVGVALIETIVVSDHGNKKATSIQNVTHAHVTEAQHQTTKSRVERPMVGILALLVACCLSGFAGVYFEKILKNTSHVSLWIRNIQLSVVAMAIGFVQICLTEYEHVANKGIFHGFTALTWLCIILQVQGGLLVAVVVKFANNILKGFATSMAIVISTIASIFIFDFQLTPTFIIGASLVICSVMMYNKQ